MPLLLFWLLRYEHGLEHEVDDAELYTMQLTAYGAVTYFRTY